MKLPKAVKEAFEAFDRASSNFGGAAKEFGAGTTTSGGEQELLDAAKRHDDAKAKLFEEINKMRRNDRRHGKEG